MKKYDGWVVKSYCGRNPWIVPYMFRERRIDVIKGFNEGAPGLWRKLRRKGLHELVKVKLVEVE